MEQMLRSVKIEKTQFIGLFFLIELLARFSTLEKKREKMNSVRSLADKSTIR